MAFIETLRSRIPWFHNETNSSVEDKRFSTVQAMEIYYYAYFEYVDRDERTDFELVRERIMGLETIPTDVLRQATIEKIRLVRGEVSGKPRDEIARLGTQFLEENLGSQEAERISELVKREAAEAAVDKKE